MVKITIGMGIASLWATSVVSYSAIFEFMIGGNIMFKKRTKLLSITIGVLIILMLALTGCGGDSDEPADGGNEGGEATYVIKIGNTSAYPSQPNVWMREFKEKIESATDEIEVQLYEASAFGGPDEMIQGLQNGSMQAVAIPVGFYASVATASEVLDMPFLFKDYNEYFYVMNSGGTELYDEYMATKGLVPITWLLESNRDIFSTKEISSFADLKGKNIRTYSSSISQAEIKAFGANPIIMATGDVPLALQQNTIDGVQCGNTLAVPAKYYDMAKYALVDAGTAVPIPVMFSKDFLDRLPQELQDLVISTARDVNINSNLEYTTKYIEDCYKELEDNGVTVTHASDEMIAEMKDAVKNVKKEFLDKNPDIKAAYKQILDQIEKYEKEGTLELIK